MLHVLHITTAHRSILKLYENFAIIHGTACQALILCKILNFLC